MEKKQMEKKIKLEEALILSTGSEQYYRHPSGAVYTDGIKSVAEIAGAYWLIDAIFSYARREVFQVWFLDVTGSTAVLTMKEDTDQPELVRQEIEFTDFPEGNWKFYAVVEEGRAVLMVPKEY
jgi:hypothetical protein